MGPPEYFQALGCAALRSERGWIGDSGEAERLVEKLPGRHLSRWRRAAPTILVALVTLVGCAGVAPAPEAPPGAALASEPPLSEPEPPLSEPEPPPPDPELPPPTPPVRPAAELVLPIDSEVDAIAAGIATSGPEGLVLRLTLDACRIVEAEPDFSAASTSREACGEANRVDFASRSQRLLSIPAGHWRVTLSNRHPERDAGLWIRGIDGANATILSAGGARPGQEQSYELDLEPGAYLYSCPLTPTIDYRLDVRP